ncbi:MAG: Rpn family recombination-promoting nuclease/putative transposase [Prevotella sp.]|jgi:predicted transposase/invertase (TIGR01784 family)|nr:Rpn family recombination-promoting nuclease/putative transposase [Prevotella sp.]
MTTTWKRTQRYLNPLTDFGFKRLFGTEMNKELLISFLNALFHDKDIRDVSYLNSEQLGDSEDDRRSVFDVYCEDAQGEKFVVEMQNVYQEFFKDRSVYYATIPIRDQGRKGDWDFELKAVYTVGVLNFCLTDDPGHYVHEVKLVDLGTKEVFYDKLTFAYIEIPKFNKDEEHLDTMWDKWMFVLRNLSHLIDRPPALQERVFTRLFEQAEIAKLSKTELRNYTYGMDTLRDYKNGLATAKKQGIALGRQEGITLGRQEGITLGTEKGIALTSRKIALSLKEMGMSVPDIIKATGLSAEEIKKL